MAIFVKLLIVLQMLIVNQHITIKCSILKNSFNKTYLYLAAFTALFLSFLYYVLPNLHEDTAFMGDGIYLLLAVVYLIPIVLLTDQPKTHTITIMSVAWVYTMFVYIISHRIAQYIYPEFLQLYSLGIQSILYILTYRSYYKMINNKFIFSIWNVGKETLYIIMGLAISSLSLLFILNYSYIHGATIINQIIAPVLLMIILILGLNLAYSFVKASKSVQDIEKRVRKDSLTRLGNREAMLEDANTRISKGEHFCLLFMDLDEFKIVNDTYGHKVGDDYLVSFSNTVRKHLGADDRFYRISGDEFVLLWSKKSCDELVEKLEEFEFLNNPMGIEFRGLSTGYAYYPEEEKDIVSLLAMADERMYQIKKRKHKNLVN
ncbi:GGDEF domain-containing protein [Gudongella sp. DL1XJH-153]|uniref:GGDEF domain-containing protein n=1 Tax=Gudongella sp. DL1XJH-153 TaxID=3409804 RepID=UPI003BB7C99C